MNKILLFGNPNVGKTSVFNALTNSDEKVSNFDGATIQKKEAKFTEVEKKLIDIPGTITLSGATILEKSVFNYLLEKDYEMVIDVIDVTNFKRNSYLLIDLLETGNHINIVLNMMDIFNGEINCDAISKALSVNVITMKKDKTNVSAKELTQKNDNHFVLDYGVEIEECIAKLIPLVKNDLTLDKRFIAIQYLKDNPLVTNEMINLEKAKEYKKQANQKITEANLAKNCGGYIFLKRREFISNLMKNNMTIKQTNEELKFINKYFDKIALHKFFGYILFMAIMYLVFVITYTGGILQDMMDEAITFVSENIITMLSVFNPPEWLLSFIGDGVIAGIGGVLVFLPQIVILFALLTFLESVGYFSRVTVLFEHLFEKLGLSSHSLIPYISGLGCNVFAIMSTRTIKSEPKRIATILTAPFISCSARLPVYIIFIDLFFENNKALMLLFIYLLGIFVAIVMAFVIDKIIYKEKAEMSIYSLPNYKKVNFKYFKRIVSTKVKVYIKNAGKFILIGSMILWLISHLSFSGYTTEITESFVGIIANKLVFIFVPLGFGTPEAISSLFSAFLAKELAISAMLVMYNAPNIETLNQILMTQFNAASAISFMVFTLLYIPCLSTLAVIYSELKQKKFVVYSILSSLIIGYVLSFICYQLLS